MFSFVTNCQNVFQSGCTIFYSLPATNEISNCSISLLEFVVVSIMDFCYSGKYVVASHCYLNLHFPDTVCCGTSSQMLFCPAYIFLGGMSVKVFGPFFNWFLLLFVFLLLSFKSSLYIFGNSPLLDMPLANIFSPSEACLILFHRMLVLNFNEFQFINYFFHGSCLCCFI